MASRAALMELVRLASMFPSSSLTTDTSRAVITPSTWTSGAQLGDVVGQFGAGYGGVH